MSGSFSSPLRSDPVWQAALAWHRRLRADPENQALLTDHAHWLAADPAHQDAYHRVERTWLLMGALPAAQTPADAPLAEVIPLAVPSRPAKARRRWTKGALAVAACLCLLVLARLQTVIWGEGWADYASGTGEREQVTLADGSVVHLDAQSAIALDFAATHRDVTMLEGRAFFDVTADRHRPFTVTAGAVRITVVGTAFDVFRSDQGVRVAVQSGVVRVATPSGELELHPNDVAMVDSKTGQWQQQTVSEEQIAPWRQGHLVVDGQTVAQVVEDLRRYTAGVIVLRDEVIGRQTVSGVYRLDDPQAALRAVIHPTGGTVHHWPLVTVIDHDR